MTRRYGRTHPTSYLHVICPFCGHACDRSTPISFCAGCHVEYYTSESGKTVIFDTERRTPRFAWAKALMKSGGARIGAEFDD